MIDTETGFVSCEYCDWSGIIDDLVFDRWGNGRCPDCLSDLIDTDDETGYDEDQLPEV